MVFGRDEQRTQSRVEGYRVGAVGGVGGVRGVAAMVVGAAVAVAVGCGDDADAPGAPADPSATPPASSSTPPAPTGEPPVPPPPPELDAGERKPFDWVGIVGNGQSLSIGATASEVVSTTQPFGNKMLVDEGPNPKYPLDGGSPKFALAPLVEPMRGAMTGTGPGYEDRQYPNNVSGETPHSGMANEISALYRARLAADYVTLHTVTGWGGRRLTAIDKSNDSRAYRAGLMEARVFAGLAKAENKTFGVAAVVLTHGEADAMNPDYGAGLVRLIGDYDADLKAITGQTRDVVLFASQQSARGTGPNTSAMQLWRAGVANPGRIVCVGPKYQYAYSSDNLHMPAPGYRRLGEKHAEVFDAVVNQGRAWKPLQPARATRTGARIVVQFDVPNAPLRWDETLRPGHQTANVAWAKGRGFEALTAAGAQLAIDAVEITGPDAVTITLAAAPNGPVTIGYAMTPDTDSSANGGLVTGLHGQLSDSDALVGYDEQELEVELTQGSRAVAVTGRTTLGARAVRDVVTAAGAPAFWTVTAIGGPRAMTMATPWPGATGKATVKIHHDLRNYAVHATVVAP